MEILIIIWIGLLSLSAFGNDGFYQGSGQDLIPIKNNNLRVINERLEISPLSEKQCFEIKFPKSQYDKKGKLKDSAKNPNLVNKNCELLSDKSSSEFDFLTTKWHAKATYKIEALKTESNVQMGFPIPQWSKKWQGEDGLYGTYVPGAVKFKTAVNGKRVTPLKIKTVLVPNIFDEHKIHKTPAYVWKIDFKKGSFYELTAEYDFGIDYSNGYYEDREIPKSTQTWFKQYRGAESILYYLHPLKLWNATPPTEIKLILHNLKNVPSEYWTFITKADYCIDSNYIQLEWKNSLPLNDLHATYPIKKVEQELKTFLKLEDVLTWLKMMNLLQTNGNPLHVSCSFSKKIEKFSLDHSEIKKLVETCVKSCDSK